jgi:hypothetical protein
MQRAFPDRAPFNHAAGSSVDVDIALTPFVVGVAAATRRFAARRTRRGTMADFVLLYRGGSAPASDEERAAAMGAWTSWFGELGSAVKDPGNPFTEAGKRVRGDGAVGDVPSGSAASGYSILQADSLDSAATLAKGCPVLQGGGEIDVFEVFPTM